MIVDFYRIVHTPAAVAEGQSPLRVAWTIGYENAHRIGARMMAAEPSDLAPEVERMDCELTEHGVLALLNRTAGNNLY